MGLQYRLESVVFLLCAQLITEQAYVPLSLGAEEQGKCGSNESELQISWKDRAYNLRLNFVKVNKDCTLAKGGLLLRKKEK